MVKARVFLYTMLVVFLLVVGWPLLANGQCPETEHIHKLTYFNKTPCLDFQLTVYSSPQDKGKQLWLPAGATMNVYGKHGDMKMILVEGFYRTNPIGFHMTAYLFDTDQERNFTLAPNWSCEQLRQEFFPGEKSS